MSEHEKNVKSQLDLCRMCLASDVLLFSIANTRMQAVYEKITRTPLVNGNNRPVVVCYICHAQLQKCQKLMLLVSQSENLLLHTMGQSNEVTMKKEETCGHRANNLRPALKTTPVKYFDTSTFNIPILVKDVFEHEYLPKPEVKEEQSQSLAECMICSAVDMRTYNIAGTPLQLIYENITKTFLTSTNNRSLSACYICCSQLNKCRKLMMRSKKTETILTALIDKYSKVSTKLVDLIDLPSHNLGLPLTIRPAECCDSSDGQQLVFVEKPALKIEVKIEIEPDVYVGSPQATEMVAYDVDNADDVNKMADAVQRDSWADVQEDYTREKLKRKRRKCIKQSKQTIENDADEPKKARPRRVYKKRIRAYVHVCQICQRVFNRTNHLKDHMKIHTDDRPYECSVCHRRFIQKINLKNHIMTHTGEKPFECGICSSGFIAKSDFKRHMNTHNEERNFECDLCHRRFTQMPYLKAHLSTHTSEKPYECNICQRRFSQKPYLKNHLKRHVQRE
ncbi:zinc finger and SCAN domain-containing protein 12 isoform X2 [Amyelois transitella]|uniref:zinc finger and SCAN domain-containing protein 12 isoform X2 n=1 Tax=Amyelois transitella TaxID=680683 RepID=UPI00298FA7C2|nr:zinc finger and SCAN domain-containing protein 12 isoform X2 [Amyelois transitella]